MDSDLAYAWRPFDSSDPTTLLGTLGGRASEARDVNDLGQIVGWADTARDGRKAFVFSDKKMQDLNNQVDRGRAVLDWAIGINNAGDIVGFMSTPRPNHEQRGFLLRPIVQNTSLIGGAVPEPATISYLIIMGLVLSSLGKRKREPEQPRTITSIEDSAGEPRTQFSPHRPTPELPSARSASRELQSFLLRTDLCFGETPMLRMTHRSKRERATLTVELLERRDCPAAYSMVDLLPAPGGLQSSSSLGRVFVRVPRLWQSCIAIVTLIAPRWPAMFGPPATRSRRLSGPRAGEVQRLEAL